MCDIQHGPFVNNSVCWFCKSALKSNGDGQVPNENRNNDIQIPDASSINELVKKNLLHFCENTTIRGIPRIVKTTNRSSKSLWMFFFIILCVGLTICLTFLIRQFVEYNVIHPPRVLRDMASPFPSITLCNHRPFSYSSRKFLSERNMRNPREFAKAGNIYAQNYFYNRGFIQEYSTLTSSLSLSGYLESIPLEYHAQLGHSWKDFIIHCMVTYRNGSKHMSNSCDKTGVWKIIPHAQYINCFSYYIHPNVSNETTTIELYLYLNEEANTSRCIDCFISNVKSQLSGALLVIHKNGSYPNINQEAINLQPGTLTEVRLKTFLNVMKTPPYGRCQQNTPEILHMASDSFTYSEHLCKERMIQTEVNKKCKCNTVEYPLVNQNLPFCGALDKFIYFGNCELNSLNTAITFLQNASSSCIRDINATIENLYCKSNVTVLYHNDVVEDCFLPCLYYSYESDRSISSWPTKSFQLTLMESRLVKDIKHRKELKEYLRAVRLFHSGDESGALNILNKQEILEQKLIALLINKPNKNLHKVEEKEVLSLTSFLSQLGGLFSIWIGLTLISIVEIIELIMKFLQMCKSLKSGNHMKKTCNVSTSEQHFLDYPSVTNL